MSIIGSNILAGASGQGGGYTIERSVRLRSSASAYLSRTFGAGGSQTTWTFSCWYKRGALAQSYPDIFSTNSVAPNQNNFRWNADDTLVFYVQSSATTRAYLQTTQVFRDTSAWYHIVLTIDTTNATSTDRLRLYINGQRVTSFAAATYPSQNQTLPSYNGAITHYLGAFSSGAGFNDCYMTEINFVNAQSLTPSSFGEYDSITGVWKPMAYEGTYGTNGFYLDFNDNTTTTTLAEDKSGNGNDWTANNISLTSGSTYDSMTDTPTIYADGGNYATLNPLRNSMTLSNANMTFSATGNPASSGTIGVTSGKWYWEVSPTSTSVFLGLCDEFASMSLQLASSSTAWAYYAANGFKYSGGSGAAYGAAFASGDVIGVAFDADAGTLTFYKNNVSQGTAYSGLTTGSYFPAVSSDQSVTAGTGSINFGQRPFAYTPPTGFLSLHTGNLPEPEIVDGGEYFNAVTYTGTGTTHAITGVGFQPDFTWAKKRSGTENHTLSDVVRGVTNTLYSNLPNGEAVDPGLYSFDSDGFTAYASSGTYVAWNWKAGGAGVSNSDGSIDSTVSANPTAGFSIVTWTGTGSNATVGHGLDAAPKMIINKPNTSSDNWISWHTALGATGYIYLNNTNGSNDAASVWNSTLPTLTEFSVGTSSNVNTSGQTMVSYCFAEVEGFSRFGSYTGNNAAAGTFVYLGFRPRFLMIKSTSAGTEWVMVDTERSQYNLSDTALYANRNYSEGTVSTVNDIDILSNGFKLRNNTGYVNAAQTYIYMAFAENPFKHSLAR